MVPVDPGALGIPKHRQYPVVLLDLTLQQVLRALQVPLTQLDQSARVVHLAQ